MIWKFPSIPRPVIPNPIAADDRETLGMTVALFVYGSAILLGTAAVAGLAVRIFTAVAWGQ